MAKKPLSFEEGMEALEALVKRMEQGDMPLEQSFEAYAQAKEMLARLTGMMDAGEKRMAELTERGEETIAPEAL